MKLQGVTIDFDDRKTCGLLPDLCLRWDFRTDELEDNEELVNYWENNLKRVLTVSDKIVAGNIGTKSIVYSADPVAIEAIKRNFKDLDLQTIHYDEIMKCENCLHHDYLDEDFEK